MKNNVRKGFSQMNILNAVGIPTSKMDWFLKSVTVGSYIPGRIRVYSKALINNAQLKLKVEETMAKYNELDKVTINTITGSVLIEYQPAKIKTNKELCEIEAYIKNVQIDKWGGFYVICIWYGYWINYWTTIIKIFF